jgi:hypothetical protein
MADINSSLPVKTNSAGDVISKIADANTPSQQLKVNVDGSIDVNAAIQAGSAVQVTDGTDTLQITPSGEATVAVTQPLPAGNNNIGDVDVVSLPSDIDIRDLSFATDKVDVSGSTVQVTDGGGSLTVDSVDLDIRNLSASSDSVAAHLLDESGAPFSPTNPLPVEFFESLTETFDYNTAASVPAGGSNTHTFAAPTGFKLYDVYVSGSGRMKAELRINNNPVAVGFSSAANPVIQFSFQKGLNASGVNVTIIRTNLENQAKDLYSTIAGVV